MELNGALSNPRLLLELSRLCLLHALLLGESTARPLKPRPILRGRRPVLDAVTRVLEMADRPMRAREIQIAAQELASEILLRTSVKAALAAGASGCTPRFQRVRYGVYQVARSQSL